MSQGYALHLVDVNNLLHIGNHRFSKYSVTDVQGREIRTGGMYMVLNVLRSAKVDPLKDLIIFCFDRKSFRKQLNPNYKSSRPKMPAHLRAQADELFKWLPKIGYNALAVEGLEADDIIASAHKDLSGGARLVNIYTTDRDASFLVDSKTTLISSNTSVPNVTLSNYASTVGSKRGHYVPYNSVFLYKSICGDNDDIPAITNHSYAAFNALIQKLRSLSIDPAEVGADLEFVGPILKMLPAQLHTAALDNWELVRPQIFDMLEYQLQTIDREALREFCRIYDMRKLAERFNVELGSYGEHVTKYRIDLVDSILKSQQVNFHEEFVEEEDVDEPTVDSLTGDPVEIVAEMSAMRKNISADNSGVDEVKELLSKSAAKISESADAED